ncbi:hypothetical protein BMS3Bbin10_00426 [bacterium BMS3Bbin10]|nr:hypothetical protein BMS3Bbin10_00426 [bacterium BMS3Bbin10]
MGTPDSIVKASRGFAMEDRPCASNTSEPACDSGIDAIELPTLRFKVKQLEAQKFALEMRVRKLTVSLAVTLSRNLPYRRCK